MRSVAALFVREDSIYKSFPGVDCYDAQRGALTFPGGMPIIAHPPCRTWGKLRQFSTLAPAGEHALAIWAVDQVRQWGGILEHPEGSSLWTEAGLPAPLCGTRDYLSAGREYTLRVDQHWWGHQARKRTWLFICGIPLGRLPALPVVLGEPRYTVTGGRPWHKKGLSPGARDKTPLAFAQWLVDAARETGIKGEL